MTPHPAQTHTPTPWISPGTDGGDRVISATITFKRRTIAHVYGKTNSIRDANAAYIVQAVNSHEALVKIATRLYWLMESGDMEGKDWKEFGELEQALYAVEGGTP